MDTRTIVSILSTLADLRGAARQRPATRPIALVAICVILAACAGIAAMGCAAAALWSYALPTQGPVGAALVVALVLAVLAAGFALTSWIAVSRRHVAEPPPDLVEQAMKLGQCLSGALPKGDEIERLVKDHAGTLVLAALVAGVVAGASRR